MGKQKTAREEARMEKFYTIDQVAQLFSVTRVTVYDWMKTGRLAYVQVGGRRRVTQSAIDAFIQPGGNLQMVAGGQEIKTRAPALAL